MMSRYEEAFRKAADAAGEPQPRVERNWLMEWITNDCRNKLCIDGGVTIDDGKNCRYYRCPLCDRSKVSSAAVYKGRIEEWTPAEMEARMHDRRDVYYDKDFRYKRGKDIMVLLSDISGGEKVKVQEPVEGDGPF